MSLEICGLSRECFLQISLKFDSIGYMPYLRQILTSKPQKSSHDTSPYLFTFKFVNFIRQYPHPENVKFKPIYAFCNFEAFKLGAGAPSRLKARKKSDEKSAIRIVVLPRPLSCFAFLAR